MLSFTPTASDLSPVLTVLLSTSRIFVNFFFSSVEEIFETRIDRNLSFDINSEWDRVK